jgi:hypothetical protein
MLRNALVLATVIAICGVGSLPANANTALHGYCAPAATQCIDNGSNSPTSKNPPQSFGFTVGSGPMSGDFVMDILVPNNEDSSPSKWDYLITSTKGGLSGTANLFHTTAWTSGKLDGYLGISASPSNPIGAYLDSSEAKIDSKATGFYVYQVDLGKATLQSPSNPNVSPLLNIGAGSSVLPAGSYIVAFLDEVVTTKKGKGTTTTSQWLATANSGAIFETGTPSTPAPEPATLTLFGSGLIAMAGLIRRRRSA